MDLNSNLPSSTRHGPLHHFAFCVCFLCFASVEVVLQHHVLSSSAWNLHSAGLSHLSTRTIGMLHYADSCCRLTCQSLTLHGTIIYDTHAPRVHTQSSGIHNVGLWSPVEATIYADMIVKLQRSWKEMKVGHLLWVQLMWCMLCSRCVICCMLWRDMWCSLWRKAQVSYCLQFWGDLLFCYPLLKLFTYALL